MRIENIRFRFITHPIYLVNKPESKVNCKVFMKNIYLKIKEKYIFLY